MAAPQHEIEIIDGLQLCRTGEDGLNHGAVGVVNEEHDVGKLQRGSAADGHTGRNALKNSAFGGADGSLCAPGVIIRLQVHCADQTETVGSVRLGAVQADHASGMGLKHPTHSILHGGMNAGNASLGLAEPNLGQGQTEGGRGISNFVDHRCPVFGLTGELVTGHHSPAAGIGLGKIGEQNVSGKKARLHDVVLSVRGFRAVWP